MIRVLREKCAEEGFDLCHPIHTQWYNNLIEEEGLAKSTLKKIPEPQTIFEGVNNSRKKSFMRDGGDDDDDELEQNSYNAVLIGNSKSLWPKFIDWLLLQYEKKLRKERQDDKNKEQILNQLLNSDPFDEFVTETLTEIFRDWTTQNKHNNDSNDETSRTTLESYEFFWSNGLHHKVNLDTSRSGGVVISHDKEQVENNNDDEYHCCYDAPNNDEKGNSRKTFLVSMQRVAKITGKYWHDEDGTKLCVHPKFGTWKAFRAVVVFHTKSSCSLLHQKSSIPKAPPLCPCPVDPEEIKKAKEVMEYALTMMSEKGENADKGYGGGRIPSQDLCKYLHNSVTGGSEWSEVPSEMRPWIQLRDCISVGRREYKYSDNQLLYHYTKDTKILKRELQQLKKSSSDSTK